MPAAGEPLELDQWWRGFEDPLLERLVDQALAHNLDLQLARERLREARASARVSSAGLWPSLTGTASALRSHEPRGIRAGSALPENVAEQPGGGETLDLYQGGLDAAWEIDVFGGTRRAVEAANANVEATVEDGRATLISLVAELVMNYIDLRSAQARLRTAAATLAGQDDMLGLVRSRFEADLASARDVAQAESAVADTRAAIPPMEMAAGQALHRLGVLLGSPPNMLVRELEQPGPVPATRTAPALGLPADLLRRRPDVRAAERRIAEANAQIGVAIANRYPSLSLTGTLGFTATEAGDLGTGDSRSWSFGPSLSVPIFNAGRLAAEADVQRARWQQAATRYRSTVLTAAAEVEDAIAAYRSEQRRRDALGDAVAAHRQSLALSRDLYESGLSDFLDVLDAERTLFTAEDHLIQSEAQLAVQMATLCKALGGGWLLGP